LPTADQLPLPISVLQEERDKMIMDHDGHRDEVPGSEDIQSSQKHAQRSGLSELARKRLRRKRIKALTKGKTSNKLKAKKHLTKQLAALDKRLTKVKSKPPLPTLPTTDVTVHTDNTIIVSTPSTITKAPQHVDLPVITPLSLPVVTSPIVDSNPMTSTPVVPTEWGNQGYNSADYYGTAQYGAHGYGYGQYDNTWQTWPQQPYYQQQQQLQWAQLVY
jgi:hypothetical protein